MRGVKGLLGDCYNSTIATVSAVLVGSPFTDAQANTASKHRECAGSYRALGY
jgi:hypothetical protein